MGFGLFQFFFFAIFAIVIVMFVVTLAKNLAQWNHNNHSPRLTVDAEVVSRYGNTTHHNHDGHIHSSTTYYVVFQVESGDRMEFKVPRSEYGFLVEGDRGTLSFQGTRYLGFVRE